MTLPLDLIVCFKQTAVDSPDQVAHSVMEFPLKLGILGNSPQHPLANAHGNRIIGSTQFGFKLAYPIAQPYMQLTQSSRHAR